MSMKDEAAERKMRAHYQLLIIIWAAQFMSIILFAMLALFVLRSNEEAGNMLLSYIFMGAGAFLVTLSFSVRQKFLAQAVEQQSPSRLQQGYIMAWVMCEIAGLLGVLTRAITASPYFYVLFLLAALGLVLHIPRREHLAAASHRKQF